MPPRGRPTLVVLPLVASSSVASLSSASFCDDAAACLPIPCSRGFSRLSAQLRPPRGVWPLECIKLSSRNHATECHSSVSHAKVVGLDVYYTSTGAPTPRFKGKQTLPLGRNLTIVFATLNRIPTPPGTSFAAAASGFPFSMSGSTCDAQAIAIPLGLGGVHFSGRPCPLPPGLQKTNVTVLLPAVLPLGQLSFLNMQSLSLDVKQVLPSVDGAPEVKLCCSRVHSEIFSPGGRPTFGFGFNPFG